MDKNSNIEYIDGVKVVHTRLKYAWFIGKKTVYHEHLEMYDSNNNRFYTNTWSIEDANKIIEQLAEEGKTAIIGPKAPCRDPLTGQAIPNRGNAVGVYIVSTKEKTK